MQPLQGIRVLDFSTLLPGPFATWLLAEAGADVLKVERPGAAAAMAAEGSALARVGTQLAMFDRGKRSIQLDLKSAAARGALRPLLQTADVLLEQFRPGVTSRLGFDYVAVKALNRRIVYCSLTGYGQTGSKAGVAAHDLNYLADVGMLGLGAGADGAPVIPPGLIADIGGGALPTVINILLGLRAAEATGAGCYLDVAMCDNLAAWMFGGFACVAHEGRWPRPGAEMLSGGSPRYQLYRTSDGRYIAAGALEQKFWNNFCQAIDLPAELRRDADDPVATKAAVARIIGGQTSEHWSNVFAGRDVCCNVVSTLQETSESEIGGRLLREDGTAVPPLAPALYQNAVRAPHIWPEAEAALENAAS